MNLKFSYHSQTTASVAFLAVPLVLKFCFFSKVLSLLEVTGNPEAIRMVMMTLCRHEKHFMDDSLDAALKKSMKRFVAIYKVIHEYFAFENSVF